MHAGVVMVVSQRKHASGDAGTGSVTVTSWSVKLEAYPSRNMYPGLRLADFAGSSNGRLD
jgi:hypothetical protein